MSEVSSFFTASNASLWNLFTDDIANSGSSQSVWVVRCPEGMTSTTISTTEGRAAGDAAGGAWRGAGDFLAAAWAKAAT